MKSGCSSTVSLARAAVLFAFSFAAFALPGGTRGGALAAPSETVTLMAADCITPRTTFYLGETVCAVVEGAPPPADGWRQRSFQWVTPNYWVTQQTEILKEMQWEVFTIPASGDFARVGKWSLRTVDNEPGTQTLTTFFVRDPRTRYADLLAELRGPATVAPGERIEHTLSVSNQGPEAAQAVEFIVSVPTETAFVAMRQLSGNPFSCTTPARGGDGKTVCKAEALKVGEAAEFAFYYGVHDFARDEAVSSTTAEIYNLSVGEADKENNAATVEASVIVPREDGGDQGEEP